MKLCKLKLICKKKNIAVSNIERDLKFPRGSIGKWNKHTPSIDKVIMVAEYLKIKLDDLI